MKTNRVFRTSAVVLATLAANAVAHAAVAVDGIRGGGETEYTSVATQAHTTAWGTGNALANIHKAETGKLLNLFVAGRANTNAIIVFIDSKPGVGVTTITNDLIRSGGEESFINNLAPAVGVGMKFETGFAPDHAIRIYGGGAEAYVGHYDLVKRIRIDLGRADNATVSHGPVSQLRVNWADVGADQSTYASAVNGVEMALNMALLGVPQGTNDVKIMAILVNDNSTLAPNQTLGSLFNNTVMNANVRTFDFQTEAEAQHLVISVDRPALVAGEDEDGDGISNGTDPFPLEPTRDVNFSVNMKVQFAKGHFDPPSSVQVQFYTGSEPELSTLALTDSDSDLIYTGTLANAKGFAGDSFGTYKFITADSQSPNGGIEFGFDRTFNLSAAGALQSLGTVFFSNEANLSFTGWSAANAGSQGADQDFDGDGVENGLEYFMGETGSSFTANPQVISGAVSWPRSPFVAGATFAVWTSETLTSWMNDTANADISNPAFVKYTLPQSAPKQFVRFAVTVP